MRIKSRKNKVVRNFIRKNIILLSLIGIFLLSYKGYNYFHKSNVQAKVEMLASKEIIAKCDEEVIVKKDEDEKKKQLDINEKGLNESKTGEKYSYDAEKVRDILDNKLQNDGKKIAFLTFDDGPSVTVTPEVLDILKKYDAKATFCLIGQNIQANEKSKELVKRTFEEGHALANHTYTHNFKKLYPGNKINIDVYMREVDQTNQAIKDILGKNFHTRVLRMPGGYMSRQYYKDPNLEAFNAKLREKNMYSIDWNAYNADAEGKKKNPAQLLEEVKKSVQAKEKVVILMHDTYGKEQTAKALPQIIEYLKANGYEFKTIT